MFELRALTHPELIAHAGERHDRSEPEAVTTPMHPPDALEIEERVSLESEMRNPAGMHMENSHTTGTDLNRTSCSVESCIHSSTGSETSAAQAAPLTQAKAFFAPPPETLVGLLIGVPIALHIGRKKLWP